MPPIAEYPSLLTEMNLVWEAKKILQTYAYGWSIEGFHHDAKQSLGLEDYQMRKINGVKRYVSMVFIICVHPPVAWLWL